MTRTIRVRFPERLDMDTILKNVLDGYETTDEDGNKVYRQYTHDWSVDYIGKLVKEKAEFDEDGNLISEATFWNGQRANIRIHTDNEDIIKEELLTAFTEVSPITPDRRFA